jgi:gamma-tubulin complex component 2
MGIISSISVAIEEAKARGGQVLTILHEKALSMVGDAGGQKLCYNLAEAASQPYFHILENWIYKVIHSQMFSLSCYPLGTET